MPLTVFIPPGTFMDKKEGFVHKYTYPPNESKGEKKMKIAQVTQDNFDAEVLQAKQKVLVDFSATWCGPCKMLSPILEEVAEGLGDKAKIYKVDIDENPVLTAKYQVMSVPTMIVFSQGEPVQTVVGVRPADQIKELLDL